jgi:hypothetical protein
MVQTREDRAEELAKSEDLDVLWSALYGALEADLSSSGWPNDSQILLENASKSVEDLIALAGGS